jgi:hypothetical protein
MNESGAQRPGCNFRPLRDLVEAEAAAEKAEEEEWFQNELGMETPPSSQKLPELAEKTDQAVNKTEKSPPPQAYVLLRSMVMSEIPSYHFWQGRAAG